MDYDIFLKCVHNESLDTLENLRNCIGEIYEKKKLLTLLNEHMVSKNQSSESESDVPETLAFTSFIIKVIMTKEYEGDYYVEDLKIEFEHKMTINISIVIDRCYSRVCFNIGNINLEEMTKTSFIKFIKKINNKFDETYIHDFIQMLCVIQNYYFRYSDFIEGKIDINFSFKPEPKPKLKSKPITDAIPKPAYTKKELNDIYTNLMKDYNKK